MFAVNMHLVRIYAQPVREDRGRRGEEEVGSREEEGREEGEEVGSTPSSLLSLVRIYAQPVRSQLTAR